MAEQEAKVVFSETGSEGVVNAFKNVGGEAGKASTGIGQAGDAMKQVGGGMKSAVSNIAQTATAFATLALSVVSTYRAYRDLGDAQLGVDRANFKVQKSTQAVANAQKLVNGLKAGMRKTDLEAVAAASKIAAREEALNKKRHEHSITNKAAKAEQDAINLARSKIGSNKAAELAKAEQDLTNKTEALGLAQESAEQKQKHFNDATQDFYLSLLPTAISVIATAVSGFESMKNIIGGGGTGLIGSLSGIGLVLGGASVAILAYQNNWLGFRDVVGGAIDWVKERLDLWKQGFQEVFDLVKKGDWSGAWNRIKEGAAKFWEDLKKSVPFFGAVETLVNNIKNGKWSDAFNQIKEAAVFFWVELKKAIPLFGTVENIIAQIRAGDWEGVFTEIGAAIKKGLESIFGGDVAEKIVLKFQLMKDSAYTEMNLMQESLNKKGGPIDLIQQGLAKLGKGDFIGGFTQIWTGFDKAVGIFIARVNDWVKLNFGIDLKLLNQQANAIGVKILDGIKSGLTFVSRTWIDPILASMLDPANWAKGIIAQGEFITRIGQAIYTAVGTGLSNAAKDPKGVQTWWADLGNAIWKGISDWFTSNIPDTKAALEKLAIALVNGVEKAKIQFMNVGIAMWNNIVEGIRSLTGGALSPIGGALDALKKQPIKIPANLDFQASAGTVGKAGVSKMVQNANGTFTWTGAGVKLPGEIAIDENKEVAKLQQQFGGVAQKMERGGYTVPKMKVGLDEPSLDTLMATAKTNVEKAPPAKMPVDGNVNPLNKTMQVQVGSIAKTKGIMKIDATDSLARQKLAAIKNAINSTKATIKVGITPYSPAARVMGQSSYDAMVRKALNAQGGMHGTLSRDTLIHAHAGEKVDIGKPGTHGPTGGSGGGNVNVRVFIGDTELKQMIHYTVNEDQGNSK